MNKIGFSLCIMQSSAGPSFTMDDIEEVDLYNPDPVNLRDILENGLTNSQKFSNVTVEWTSDQDQVNLIAKDLLQEPFCLAASGLGGNTAILDVGDLSYWKPKPDSTKVYNIRKILNSPKLFPKYSFIFGNGFSRSTGELSELVINELFTPKADGLSPYMNKNHIVYGIQQPNYKCHVQWLSKKPLECYMKGTFFLCEGIESEILKICAKADTSIVKSPLDFTDSIHMAIRQEFGTREKNIVLGGIFKVDTRLGWRHVVTRNDWRRSSGYRQYYCNVKKSEAIISIFDSSPETPKPHSPENSLIRSNVIQSTHCLFHQYAENSHQFYENEVVEFTGYFNPAQKLYRVIKPIK